MNFVHINYIGKVWYSRRTCMEVIVRSNQSPTNVIMLIRINVIISEILFYYLYTTWTLKIKTLNGF